MTIEEVRDRILALSDIEVHAERAGFRRARSRHLWHCGVHLDDDPSCTISRGRIHCWSACEKMWDVIDLEMVSTGKRYVDALRDLASEYGIEWNLSSNLPPRKKISRRDRIRAEYWKLGYLQEIEAKLADAKGRMFTLEGVSATVILEVEALEAERARVKYLQRQSLYEEYLRKLTSDARRALRLVKDGQEWDDFGRSVGLWAREMIRSGRSLDIPSWMPYVKPPGEVF